MSLIRSNCPRCGSFESVTITTTPDYELNIHLPFEVSRCSSCSFVYTSVRPDFKTLFSEFYPDNYICYGSKQYWLASVIDHQRIKKQALQRFNCIKKYLSPENSRILEVGCATGEFLKLCLRYSNEVYGIEPNRVLFDSLSKSGIKMFNSTLEETDIEKSSFDLICLFNVFEHLWDPVQSLYKLNSLLRPDGVLMLEVPNFDSPWRKIFQNHWFLYHLPRHLSHFTSGILSGLMADSGFDKVNISKQFRPTVNVLSLKYVIRDRFQSRCLSTIFKESNPIVLGMAVLAELFSNFCFDSNIMLCIYRKTKDVVNRPSLIEEKQYDITRAV